MDLVVFTSADSGSRASIAAAFFNVLAVPSLAVAIPAVPHPVVIDDEFLAAVGDLGRQFTPVPPSRFTTELGQKASLIVYIGCAASTSKIEGIPSLEWDIAPAKGDPKEAARLVRDSILRAVEGLLVQRGWLRPERTPNGR
jgi:hypothetical protein